jgi:hypothetical protein
MQDDQQSCTLPRTGLPSSATKLGRRPNDPFDRGSAFLGLQCVQGSVALNDQEETDAYFSCWPGSYRQRESLISGLNWGDMIDLMPS